jgi:hypothetical protein
VLYVMTFRECYIIILFIEFLTEVFDIFFVALRLHAGLIVACITN